MVMIGAKGLLLQLSNSLKGSQSMSEFFIPVLILGPLDSGFRHM